MADRAPKTRNWRALENAHKLPKESKKHWHVLVFGEVEVGATNMDPVLDETPERDPKNLGLNLTIKTSGEGADVKVWKTAHFHKVVKPHDYDNVVIRWNVDQIAKVPVLDDNEHHAAAADAMTAVNQRYAKRKGAKAAGKKPAKKKPAAKKYAAKKKPAKKAAKKSGLKKLVGKLVKKLSPAKKKKRR